MPSGSDGEDSVKISHLVITARLGQRVQVGEATIWYSKANGSAELRMNILAPNSCRVARTERFGDTGETREEWKDPKECE